MGHKARISKAEIMKKVRAKCLDCSGHNRTEIKCCEVESCPLFDLRMGLNNYPCGLFDPLTGQFVDETDET